MVIAALGWLERASTKKRNAGIEDLQAALGARGELVTAMRERVDWLTDQELACRGEVADLKRRLGVPVDETPRTLPPPLPTYPPTPAKEHA